MIVDTCEFGTGLGTQFFKFSECTGQHDLGLQIVPLESGALLLRDDVVISMPPHDLWLQGPDQVIGWRSIEGSDVVSAGSVNFDEAGIGRGTRVRVRLQYSPPGGKLGDAIARLFRSDAASEIRQDLRRFKQLVEEGQTTT